MTTLDHATLPMTGTTRPAIAARVFENLAQRYRIWKNRRAVYQLGLLSEWELSDIGLTRCDLHVAWREPFGADPTVTLGAIAEARAKAELRSARESAARLVC